jgi:non-specific serine/threonine protein kinase
VALKVLPARLAGDPIWLRRFEREARYLAAVDHPNIANVYTLEESDGVRFLTMELVEGPTLRDRLASGALPLPDAMSVLAQTARALETLHRQDIAHCDLKPDNVLLSEDDHVTLIDFGLARRRDDWRAGGPRSPAGDREESGSGTPGYMAPEQVEGRGVEPAADLWAFGCVAYECITGAPAFPGTTRERLDATLHETPEWERLPRELAPRVRETTLRCLEKRPEDRPAGIAEIRRVLEEELDELGRDPETPASAPVHDLPVWSNVFVGRTSHVDTLAKRLERTRLLTLTGPGGCGKTRLASFVGRRRLGAYADGVRFVGLCAARTSEQALQSIAAGCSVSVDPGADTLDALAAALTEKRLLLILDNCEHLRDACRAVCERLLDECAGITILATSREALRAASETVYVVPPLSGPGASASENPADLADVESVALFVARAAEADPDFRLTKDNVSRVARLCASKGFRSQSNSRRRAEKSGAWPAPRRKRSRT